MKNIMDKVIFEFESFKENAGGSQPPAWDSLPAIELYMDQVIILLNQYLAGDVSAPVTQSMVNNYVKLKAVPAPVKKRYSRVHLAYLIIFCTLKQTLNIATIQKIMPVDLSEEEVKQKYADFLENRQKAFDYAKEQTSIIAKSVSTAKKDDGDKAFDAVMQVSAIATVFKLLTERILKDEETKEK